MSQGNQTMHAIAFVAAYRKHVMRDPTWKDVAIAYDEGLRHAVTAPATMRRKILSYLQALRVINAARNESKS